MTSSGATENFFAMGRLVRGSAGLPLNADCKHCGRVITWNEGRLQWVLTDPGSQYFTICETRYEKDHSWAVIPELVHEANSNLPDVEAGTEDLERWLES